MMQAAVIKSKGVIQVEQVPIPKPQSGEVLLKVERAALCGTDQRVLRGEKAVAVPIIGHEIAGTVVEVGTGVTSRYLQHRYAVQTVVGCGTCLACQRQQQNQCEAGFKAIGYAWNGGFAEYMIVPRPAVEQHCLISLPDTFTMEQGALLEPISCCVNGLRYLPLEAMSRVVVLGAGIIGLLNALVAKARGAKEVIVMNRSPQRLDLIRQLGFPVDHTVDLSQHDALDWMKQHTGGKGVEGVIVSASVKSYASLGVQLLAIGGHLSLFAGVNKEDPWEMIDLNLIHYRELHIHGANSSVQRDYLEAIRLLEDGSIDALKLITHRFPLSRFSEAFAAQTDPTSQALKIMIGGLG
jgi:L-iditol 2-dehydrogenase